MRLLLLVSLGFALWGCGDKDDTDAHSPQPVDTDITADDSGDTDTPADDTGDTQKGDPDYDGDGSPDEEDCSDTNPEIYPGAEEVPYDGIDQDCNGYDLIDVDSDGYDAVKAGGDDCNDEDPTIHPGADDVVGNNTDDDCDGEIDEGYDEVPEGFPLTFSGSGAASSRFVAVSSDGYVVIGGSFTGEIDFHPYDKHAKETAAADGDIFLSQLSPDGEYRWTWVATSDESLTINAISADTEGHILIAGSFSGTADFDSDSDKYLLTASGGSDAFIARISDEGALLWVTAFGGKGDDTALGVDSGTDGRAYATGSFSSTATFIKKDGAVTATGAEDAWMVQLDSLGETTWAATFGGEGATASGVAITSDSENNVTMAGQYSGSVAIMEKVSTDSDEGLFMVEYDLEGIAQWGQSLPGTLSVSALITDSSDSLYLGGTLSGSADFDASEDGEASLTATGSDGFVCAMNSFGAYSSATLYGSSGDDTIDALALDLTDELYVAGTFHGSMTVGSHTETAAGSRDVFALRLNTDMSLDWMMRIGNSTDDGVAGITSDQDRRGWLVGTFTEILDLDPTEGDDSRSEPKGESGVWAVRVQGGGP